jgi:hypothetical protein
MTIITKPMIVVSAVIAMALVGGLDMIGPKAAQSRDTSPASTISERFPSAVQATAALDHAGTQNPNAGSAAQRGDRMVPAATCTHEHWPYIADECLVSEDVAAARKPARTITIEKRLGGKAPQVTAAHSVPAPARLASAVTTVASR